MGYSSRRVLILIVVIILSWFWFSTDQPRTVPAVHDGLDSVLEGGR